MAEQHFITSRYGTIREMKYYTYAYSNALIKNPDVKQRFINHLQLPNKNLAVSIAIDHFTTIGPMALPNGQYRLLRTTSVLPPFDNIPQVSAWLNKKIRSQFENNYIPYRTENTFIIEDIKIGDFKLLKCFKYNIELFADGRFLIHFVPTSRIRTDIPITVELYRKYKASAKDNHEGLSLNLVSEKRSSSRKIYFDQDRAETIFKSTINHWDDVYATIDYELLSIIAPIPFYTIMKRSKTKISHDIDLLKSVSSSIVSKEEITLFEKPFLPVKVNQSSNPNNLVIGNNKVVSKLSATYFSGINTPVMNKSIVPFIIGDNANNVAYFKNLISGHFNAHGSISWHEEILLPSNAITDDAIVEKLAPKIDKKTTLIVIFSVGTIPSEILKSLQKSKWKYQIYQGNKDQYKLSNFAIKCLTKLGGIPALLNNSHESTGTYFIGIDLGHKHGDNKTKMSNLALVFFDQSGKHIYQYVTKDIQINEVIQEVDLLLCLQKFSDHIVKMKLSKAKKLIFHRDGRIHATEITSMIASCNMVFGLEAVDIVEIIKSGYPIMCMDVKATNKNPISGTRWQVVNNGYAILVTSDQANDNAETLNPIIIKHKHGDTDFAKIVDQVYWFTKLYSTNIYYSTRLPITTATANNIVGAGSKKHQASYKG